MKVFYIFLPAIIMTILLGMMTYFAVRNENNQKQWYENCMAKSPQPAEKWENDRCHIWEAETFNGENLTS